MAARGWYPSTVGWSASHTSRPPAAAQVRRLESSRCVRFVLIQIFLSYLWTPSHIRRPNGLQRDTGSPHPNGQEPRENLAHLPSLGPHPERPAPASVHRDHQGVPASLSGLLRVRARPPWRSRGTAHAARLSR